MTSRRGLAAARLALLAGSLAGCFSDRPATEPESPAGGGSSVAIFGSGLDALVIGSFLVSKPSID